MSLIRLFVLSCCIVMASCGLDSSLNSQKPLLVVSRPFGEMLDQKVEIQVENLRAFQEIELKADAKDARGRIWYSHALFLADAEGNVDVSSSCPLQNSSYEVADGMGLFWSMFPLDGNDVLSFKCKNDCFSVNIKLYVENKLVYEEVVTNYIKSPQVKKINVRESGLIASLFLPESELPLPVIITLTGSNGGLAENRSKLLASNGFAVLSLGYFGLEGLPSNLQDIPLEYFETAFAWLKDNPSIDPRRIGIYGVSRGAELALLLGSVFSESIQAIVSALPSSVIYGGDSGYRSVNAWIYKGKPILPFASVIEVDFSDGKGLTHENPLNLRQKFISGMTKQEDSASAAIPVEKIHCPILLVSGGDDQIWPSELFSKQIEARLSKCNSKISCRHLNYPNAGHNITIPNFPILRSAYYNPIEEKWFSMGGTQSANAKASYDSWAKIVSFFHETLIE